MPAAPSRPVLPTVLPTVPPVGSAVAAPAGPGAHARRRTPVAPVAGRAARVAVVGLTLTLAVLAVVVGIVVLRPAPGEDLAAETVGASVGASVDASVGRALARAGVDSLDTVDGRVVLREWDRRRARAWARGDPAALRALYRPGSAAGARDAAMLQRWRARGLRVTGLRTQVLALRVVSAEPRTLVLRVTDRVSSAVAAGPGVRVALPRDEPETRRITLTWGQGEWRVAGVRLLA